MCSNIGEIYHFFILGQYSPLVLMSIRTTNDRIKTPYVQGNNVYITILLFCTHIHVRLIHIRMPTINMYIIILKSFVSFISQFRVHFQSAFVFLSVASSLEPSFYSSYGQTKLDGQLVATRTSHIYVSVVFFFQFYELSFREYCPMKSSDRFNLSIRIYWLLNKTIYMYHAHSIEYGEKINVQPFVELVDSISKGDRFSFARRFWKYKIIVFPGRPNLLASLQQLGVSKYLHVSNSFPSSSSCSCVNAVRRLTLPILASESVWSGNANVYFLNCK